MPNLIDTSYLDSVARRLVMQAEGLRAHAGRLNLSTDAARWQSVAAARFRAQAHAIVAQVRLTAGRVESAGLVLAAHSRRVRSAEAELAAAAHAVLGVMQTVSTVGTELVGDVVNLLHPGRH